MLSKITINNVASFKRSTTLETDKKVNLLYGLNGVGKSTLSSFLYNPKSSRFSYCTMEGLNNDDTILVYNQDFIRDHFYEPEGIGGIFTLSKENKEINEIINKTNKEINDLIANKKDQIEKKKELEASHKKRKSDYVDKIWNIKINYSRDEESLNFCLDGYKKNKSSLFEKLLSTEYSADKLDYTIDDLKKEAKFLIGDLKEKNTIQNMKIDFTSIENSKLLSKVILGNTDSSISDLIDMLGNSDWVNEGIKYIQVDGDKAKCPFCQKETITKDFLKSITDYFDENYKNDKEMLSEIKNDYYKKSEILFEYIKEIKKNEYLSDNRQKIEKIELELINLIDENKKILTQKEKFPSNIVELRSINQYEYEINEIVLDINNKINDYNNKIKDINGTKEKIKDKFWELMRGEYSSAIDSYLFEKKNSNNEIEKIEKEISELDMTIGKKKEIVSDNMKHTVNIDNAVESIKKNLVDIGITDFTIEKYSEEKALYRLKRGNENLESSSSNIFQTLSEGEKMVISFLYFIELCKGEKNNREISNNKIVVIDDPISSLSHIYVFNIGRLIHNEFLRTETYNQIFILTHSLYFFYELTQMNKDRRKESQKLFRICKNDTGSFFVEMKYEEIQNDYQAYWSIVNDKNQPPALIANCMRNILEYFFNFVEKQDFNNIFQKPELHNVKFQSFNRYMNRESHSKGQNIFDIKEFDYESFREAFKLVFEITGYKEHYKKMSKKK